MHEVSVALSLLEMIENKCREEGYFSVESVKVRVGKASTILPEALNLAFEIAKKETVARGDELLIDLIPLRAQCKSCLNSFEGENSYIFECPFCKSPSFKVISGNELELVEMEVAT
jgi:hydrogenase nickel incorporation protein HypA/HybF